MGKIKNEFEAWKGFVPRSELAKARVGVGRILGGLALSGAGAELHYTDPSWVGRNIMAWGLTFYGAYKMVDGFTDHAKSVWHIGEETEQTENT